MSTVFDLVQAACIVVFLIGFASVPAALAALLATHGEGGVRASTAPPR